MASLLGNLDKGILFVLSAPAGTGKTTLTQMLTQEFPMIFQSISFTTRQPRAIEIPGKDYHFISESEFQKKIALGEFLEYATLYGYYYGTSKQLVEEQLSKGKHVFLVIDTQGAMQLKGKIDAVFIFLKPPSIDSLKKRLNLRQTENQETIDRRLQIASQELDMAKEYDYLIINETIDIAYEILRSVVIAETHKIKNLKIG